MPDNIDYNAFAFRNTTVGKFMEKINKAKKDKRKEGKPGAAGTTFITEKPKTTA